MDLREKKTKRSIKNAFLQLRAQKPLERITVKELAELAEISKATFYLHYRDIYDLSDGLQREIIQEILDSLIGGSDPSVLKSDQFVRRLFDAFFSRQSLIDLLFSGTQSVILPISIEQGFREYFFELHPELRADVSFNVALSYSVYGSYYAYAENGRRFDMEQVLKRIDEITVNFW